ncbi:MAG: nucleotidyltransferase family protein [Alphaproteobacteria bacterium]
MASSPWHLETLRTVQDLELDDWAIGAGFVRNAVWDRLHGFAVPTPLCDIDVLFFDPSHTDPAWEKHLEATLGDALGHRPWSVRNQARMHRRNCDQPYRSTQDAISFWLEVPTCVAVRLDDADDISIIAPYGLSNLVEMRGAPTQAGLKKYDQYLERMRTKNWPASWPMVTVVGLN